MRRLQINYKSGNTVHIDYANNVNVKHDSKGVTAIDVDGMVGGAHPLYWGMDSIESVVVVSVGWQGVFEYIARLGARIWNKVVGR